MKTALAALSIPMEPTISFSLNPDLDRDQLSKCYRETGRVRAYGLLANGAAELHDHLRTREDWIQVIHSPGQPIELNREQRAEMGRRRYAKIENEINSRGRSGFQYRYEAIRIPGIGEYLPGEAVLMEYARFLQSSEMLELIHDITGQKPGLFVNGQATSYDAGDFLTGHDDNVAGDGRIAAFVLGLTKMWRLEWGGLLLFHGPHDRTAEALAPRFNTLDLFNVPQQHSVSYVCPTAGFSRMAITGWYRAAAPDT